MFKFNKKNLKDLLKKWANDFEVFAPCMENGETLLLPYDENLFTMDYTNFPLSIKEFFFEQKETLFKWHKTEKGIEIVEPDYRGIENKILFGVRACDAYGAAYMDKFFTKDFVDGNYVHRKEKTWIVAVNCTEVAKNCFCNSMGVGPFAKKGYDIALTPIKDEYIVEVGTEKGEKLIYLAKDFFTKVNNDDMLKEKQALLKEVKSKFIKDFNIPDIKKLLDDNFNNPIWNEFAKHCINCSGCTSVCPTCTCFNVVEENDCDGIICSNCNSSSSGIRVRYWDSCQSESFTRNAGEHNPRNISSRFRYRIYDKLKYIEQKFGMNGCTGCGRCIDTCPACIDFVNLINKLADEYAVNEKEISTSKCDSNAQIKNHACTCVNTDSNFEDKFIKYYNIPENIYLPQVAVIKDIIDETWNIKRFIIEYEDKSLHENYKFHGQFFEITVFGVGEIAISIPFSDSQRNYFDFCIKKVGKVTTAVHNMKVGDKIGLRGPFGNGFPYESIKGRDILIVGSGVGVAPVRTILTRALEHKEEFGKIVIIASAGSYEGLVYKEDLKKWGKIDDVRVLYALAKPTDKVDAHVGYINDLLPDLDLDWENTTAVVCASPRRIKFVAKDLMELGMKGCDILTSLETHMRCGVGKCGHCKVGDKYMCTDGPVFSYDEMIKLPPEF